MLHGTVCSFVEFGVWLMSNYLLCLSSNPVRRGFRPSIYIYTNTNSKQQTACLSHRYSSFWSWVSRLEDGGLNFFSLFPLCLCLRLFSMNRFFVHLTALTVTTTPNQMQQEFVHSDFNTAIADSLLGFKSCHSRVTTNRRITRTSRRRRG